MGNDAGCESIHAMKKGIEQIYEVKSSKSILYKGQAVLEAGEVSPGGITSLPTMFHLCFWPFVVNLCPKLGSE